MSVTDQPGEQPRHEDYVENVRFERSGVVFATVHVVGSENDLEPWDELAGGDRRALRLAEFAQRRAANLDWIDAAFDRAESTNAVGVLLMIQAIWIVLGAFIDWIGILLLTAPIFVPVATKLGFDPIWLGVLFCMNMQISYITPPFGPAAFYLKGVVPSDISLGDIFRSIWPYLGLQVIALGIVVSFPQVALWLPSTMAR